MGICCYFTAEKVKDYEPYMSRPVLDVIAKDPQIKHVASEMEEPSMEEHRGKYRELLLQPFVCANSTFIVSVGASPFEEGWVSALTLAWGKCVGAKATPSGISLEIIALR